MTWLDDLNFNEDGLIPAIALDANDNSVLMMAWMNDESLRATVESGKATYWSRSRRKLWQKGETSGHEQLVQELRTDCDSDVITLVVEQRGGIACHTGRKSCFYRKLKGQEWVEVEPIIRSPEEIYNNE